MAGGSKVANEPTSDSLPVSTTAAAAKLPKKLTLIPLVFLIYFEIAGGPFGEEPVVQAAGPVITLLGFLVFPFIWGVPEALIRAELSTAFPGDGGFVVWADSAFGPFFGSLMGSIKFLSGVINNAAFPVLVIDYLKKIFHVLDSGWPRKVAILSGTLVLSFLNYTGLTIVGWAAVLLGLISLTPFIIMTIMAIPMIHPKRWVSLGQKGVQKDWNLFFNTLFWNLMHCLDRRGETGSNYELMDWQSLFDKRLGRMVGARPPPHRRPHLALNYPSKLLLRLYKLRVNFWDTLSTLVGEVDKPHKTYPRALFVAVIFICLAYLLPLLAVTGAVSVDQSLWESGFHADAAQMIAGKWLKIWIEVGAVLSGIRLFEAQLSSCAYQIEGMSNLGLLPKFCGVRSKWFYTPWVGILVSTVITLPVSYMSFTDIISSANFLYSLGMLLEFASFLWLRRKQPDMERPFRVPVELPWLVMMCLVPSVFLLVIMSLATRMVYLVSGLMTAGAIGWYFLMKFLKSKKVCKWRR